MKKDILIKIADKINHKQALTELEMKIWFIAGITATMSLYKIAYKWLKQK